MKWNQFRLKTTTEAEDIVSSMLADLGIEGVQIEDKIPLTQSDKEQMFVDILPDIPEDDGCAYLTNIGDSRAYLFRKGRLKRITKDHTYVNELIEQGVITEKEAESHSQKNVITKALGAEPQAEPDFYRVSLEPDDIMMLCSDGLYGEVGEDKMTDLLAEAQYRGTGMNDLCADFVDEAILAGGRDNITVICIKI